MSVSSMSTSDKQLTNKSTMYMYNVDSMANLISYETYCLTDLPSASTRSSLRLMSNQSTPQATNRSILRFRTPAVAPVVAAAIGLHRHDDQPYPYCTSIRSKIIFGSSLPLRLSYDVRGFPSLQTHFSLSPFFLPKDYLHDLARPQCGSIKSQCRFRRAARMRHRRRPRTPGLQELA